MTESPDSGAPDDVTVTVTARDVAVEKTATEHRDDAVAVTLRIESRRSDPCEVRVTDAIPDAVQGNNLEFHPNYDPQNWSYTGDSVVYEATLKPGTITTTVYGILVDEPSQLALFASDPVVEVTDHVDIFEYWTDDEPDDRKQRDVVTEGGDRPRPKADRGGPSAAIPDDSSVVDALVSEVRERELTSEERQALREALAIDDGPEVDRRLRALRDELDALREEVTDAGPVSVEAEGLESRMDELASRLDERLRSLSVELQHLQEEVEEGARWRSKVQDSLVVDLDGE